MKIGPYKISDYSTVKVYMLLSNIVQEIYFTIRQSIKTDLYIRRQRRHLLLLSMVNVSDAMLQGNNS